MVFGWIEGTAQERKVIAQILDNESRRPIKGAKVITTKNQSAITNHLGYAELILKGREELVVSSVGYETSTVSAPTYSQIKIYLIKKYILLNPLNLAFENELNDNTKSNEQSLTVDYGQSARYGNGWSQFYNELAKYLKNDSSFYQINSQIEVRFTVTRDGIVDAIETDPVSKQEAIVRAFESLGNWYPASQNDIPIDQFFVLLVMRSTESTPSPMIEIELTAEPVGGMTAFYGFIAQNLRYPKQAKKERIEGRVMIRFIVDSDGSIKDVSVIDGIGGGCDEEAIRVISISPKWKPGTRRGVPVPQEIRLPLQFRL